MKNFQRFKCLLLKNLKTKCRTRVFFFAQIFIIFLCIGIIIVTPVAETEPLFNTYEDLRPYRGKNMDDLAFIQETFRPGVHINKRALGYTPRNEILKKIVQEAAINLQINDTIPYDTSVEMEEEMIKESIIAGIEFSRKLKGITKTPKEFSISLRFPSEFRTLSSSNSWQNLWTTHNSLKFTKNWDGTGGDDLYISEGFLQLQNALFCAYFNNVKTEKGKESDAPDIRIHPYAYHTLEDQYNLADASNINGLMLYLCFLLPCVHLIREISREKAENIMVHHTMAGFPYWLHWLSHFIAALIFFLILDVFIIALLYVRWTDSIHFESFHNAHVLTMGILLVLYNIASILFCFVIVVLCRQVDIGTLIALIIWLVMYSIFAIVLKCTNKISFGLVLGSLLFFNNVLPYGMRSIQSLDENAIKIIIQPQIWYIYGMLVLDSILYLLILCAVEVCRSHPYINKPFVWKLRPDTDLEWQVSAAEESRPNIQDTRLERKIEAVRLSNVSKIIRKRPVIKSVSLKMFENEITVLLGHNGAGKTTLLCTIAGFHTPSLGRLSFYGVNVSPVNSLNVRKDVYFCLPNNTLFDQLTVTEHLMYALAIKEADDSLKDLELIKWLAILRTNINSQKKVARISFERKRLLCLAMALCGGTKIILLDEPTTQMTHDYRKRFWDIVRSHKIGRCIIVATNSIAEAESTGDRIAIMDGGELTAYGTQFFLKRKYAPAYHLICLKNDQCKTEKVTQIVHQFVPSAKLESETRDKIHYKISYTYVQKLSKLFSSLEQKRENLGLVSLNVMGNQLSDVYTSFGDETNNLQELYDKGQSVMHNMELHEGTWLIINQILAMLFKKLLHQLPTKVPCMMMMLSAVFILLLGQMSESNVIENTKAHIDIGFKSQRESGGVFEKILDKAYNKRHRLVQIQAVTSEHKGSRSITWGSSVEPKEKSYIDIKTGEPNSLAIALPDKDTNPAEVWFNARVFHSAPLGLNLLHNALLRMEFKTSAYQTKVKNKPLPLPCKERFRLLESELSHLKIPLTIGTITPFMISSFIYFLVVERETNVRSLQFISGIRIPVYWVVPLFWDMCVLFLLIFIFTQIFFFVTTESYAIDEKLAILIILNVYGYSALCETYFFSFCFVNPLVAYFASTLVHLIKGLFAYVLYFDLFKQNVVCWWIFMLSPDFAMLSGMSVIIIENFQKKVCEEESKITGTTIAGLCKKFSKCCCNILSKWTLPGVFPCITFMISTGTFLMITMLAVEYYSFIRRFDTENIEFLKTDNGPEESVEVLKEKKRIADMDTEEYDGYNMVVDQLEDRIPSSNKKLKTVSFAVERKECLVILAEKNSGRAHLIQQLIGEKGFSFGDIYVQGLNIKEDLDIVRTLLGFCPKEKGLLMNCSGGQLMLIFCLIRGVPRKKINPVINEMILLLEMQDFIKTKVENLSLEKKRRINIAIAFIADIQVLLIDEPTAGVSAIPRRLIWNVLQYAKFTGKSIVLTTNDPWECETLADQVIIFSDGEMLYYGDLQHLRNKYANGFIFEIKIKMDGQTADEIQQNLQNDISSIRRFVSYMAVDSELRSIIDSTMRFYIPIQNMVWSRLFDLIEKNRVRLHIEDYIIDQASFHEIMLNMMSNRGTGP